jgi:DNA-binding protein HU-beta
MNRTDLVTAVADGTGLRQDAAAAAVTATLEAIAGAVAAGDSVTLTGFGTFERRHRPARAGRNPQTGEAITIEETRLPAFKPATAFKRRVAAD